MKTTIPALSKEDAMNCLKDKIIFYKVSHELIEDTDFFKEIVNIFNHKGK